MTQGMRMADEGATAGQHVRTVLKGSAAQTQTWTNGRHGGLLVFCMGGAVF